MESILKRRLGIMLPVCLCVFLFFSGSSSRLQAQHGLQNSAAHIQQVLNLSHGLPTERITDLSFGNDGYLYMASIAGLIRTDGTHIDVFNTQTTPGFKTNRIGRIFNLPSSQIIVDQIGLAYHFRDEQAVPLTNPLTGNHINTPILKNAGDDSYFIFDKENGYLFSEAGIEVISPSLNNYQLWDAELAADSTIYILNTDGFYHLEGDSVIRIPFPDFYSPDLSYYSHMTRFGDHIRIAGQSRSLCFNSLQREWHREHSTPDLTEVIHITPYPGDREAYLLGTSEGFYLEKNGSLNKVLDTGRALYHSSVFRNDKHVYIAAFDGLWHNGDKIYSPESNIIDAAMDTKGGIWLSTARDGVIHLKPNPFNLVTDERVTNSYAVAYDSNGNFWSGSFENGVVLENDGLVQHFNAGNSVLANNSLRMLAPLSDGSMLISLWGEPPYVYKNGQISQEVSFWPMFGKRTNVTEAFYEDKRGRWWLGTLGGLYLKEDGSYAAFYDKNQKTIRQISRIVPSPYSDDLFFCTVTDGLVMLRDNEFYFLTEDVPVSERQYRDVFVASADTLWLASYSGGLQRIILNEEAETEVRRLQTEQGLQSTAYHRIIPDSTGGLWISTNNGLLSTSLQALNRAADTGDHITELYWFSPKDGLTDNEFNGGSQSAGITDFSGNIWFTSMSGLVNFNPYRIGKPRLPAKKIQFQYLYTSKRHIKIQSGKQLSLKPHERNLKIRFAHISPGGSHTSEIWYRTSVNEEWTQTENPGLIALENLSNGNLSIELSTAPLNDVIQAGMLIEVQPYWHENIFFRILLLMFTGGIALTAFRYIRGRNINKSGYQPEDFGFDRIPFAGHLKVGISGNDGTESNGEEHQTDDTDPIKSLIHEHFKNPELKTDWLAGQLNMSRSALYREWKKENEISINEYIKQERLSHALHLLESGEKTITEIAYLSGFNSQSYFTKVFKKKYGTAPSEYSAEENSVSSG